MTKQLHSPFQHSIPFPTPSPHSFIHSNTQNLTMSLRHHSLTKSFWHKKTFFKILQNPKRRNKPKKLKTQKKEKGISQHHSSSLKQLNQKKERVKGVNYRSIHSIMATLKQEITLSNNQTYDFNVKGLDLLSNSLCFLFNSLETQIQD